MRRRLSERWCTFPPAAWFVVIQLELGALSVLERATARTWGQIPVAAEVCLFIAPMLGLWHLNRRFIGAVPVVVAERTTDSTGLPSGSAVAVGRAGVADPSAHSDEAPVVAAWSQSHRQDPVALQAPL